MKTLLITHPVCLEHKTVDGHPDCPKRLTTIFDILDTAQLHVERCLAPCASKKDVMLAHKQEYFDKVMSLIPQDGMWVLDDETVVSPRSGDAALRAAGAVISAVNAVLTNKAVNAFCAVRPPGHHATSNNSGGFCIFNNIAIGAMVARSQFGLRRIAIIDFDVHHGNGTQEIFWDDPNIFFTSLHQRDLQDGSGSEIEKGKYDNILNLPLPLGADGNVVRDVVSKNLVPRLQQFQPEILFVSAGFDMHRYDPLGDMMLDESDYFWLSKTLCDVAQECCKGRLIASLEGGYELSVLGASVESYIRAMTE